MVCRACGLDHPSMENCGIAKRRMANAVNTTAEVVNTIEPVKTAAVNTNAKPVNTRKADRHKPGYMKEYMANRRGTVH